MFSIDGVESVLIDVDFISVTKSDEASWEILRTILTTKIGSFLEKNNFEINLKMKDDKKIDSKTIIKWARKRHN